VSVSCVLKAFTALRGHLFQYSVRLGPTHLRKRVNARSVPLVSSVQCAQHRPSNAMRELTAKSALVNVLHVPRPTTVRRHKTYRSRVHSEPIANLVQVNVPFVQKVTIASKDHRYPSCAQPADIVALHKHSVRPVPQATTALKVR